MPKSVVQAPATPSDIPRDTTHTGTSGRATHAAIAGMALAATLPCKISPFNSKFPSLLYGPLHLSKIKPPQSPATPCGLTPPQQLLPSCTYPPPSQLSSFCISPTGRFLSLCFLNLIIYCSHSLEASGFGSRGRFRHTLSRILQICP